MNLNINLLYIYVFCQRKEYFLLKITINIMGIIKVWLRGVDGNAMGPVPLNIVAWKSFASDFLELSSQIQSDEKNQNVWT